MLPAPPSLSILVYICLCCSLQGGKSLSVQRQQLEELYSAHSGSMSILLEEDDDLHNHNLGLPQGPANFTLLWYSASLKWCSICSPLNQKQIKKTENNSY